MKTAIISSEASEQHLTGDGHPEQPKRILSIKRKLKTRKDLIWQEPDKVPNEILEITHSNEYIKNIKESFPKNGLKFLDGDTVISPGSKKAVYDAAGSVIRAINGIEKGEFKNAFCAVRPPGHHAEKNKAMGFCVINQKIWVEKFKWLKFQL